MSKKLVECHLEIEFLAPFSNRAGFRPKLGFEFREASANRTLTADEMVTVKTDV